jgi:hypothetical protein
MRNPFSVPDVHDPSGPDVEAFAERVPAGATDGDENAMAWVTITTTDEGLDGAWSSRWRTSNDDWAQGVATLSVQGDKVFILYRDAGTYLFEGVRRGDRIIGRYVNIINPGDSSPWVGVIVNNYRIDGHWGRGRWDFRRCSPEERPEPIVAALLTEARQLPPAALRELLGFARYLRWKADGRSA